GDTIQFVRYAPLIAQRGAKVIVQCPPALVKLLARTPGIESVVSENDPLPPFDFHASMMDLPMVFGTTLQTIPAQVPYLKCDPAKVERWAARLAADEPQGRPAMRIGLCWSGNPRRNQNRIRSIPLEMLSPLGALGSPLRFISLQKGFTTRNSAVTNWLTDYDDQLTDFDETAALMMNLDLIITIDTAIAHLAGALALPTWTMLCVGADWRYMAARAEIPWYPTMKLIRQTRWNDWTPVVGQIVQMLKAVH
ncbi:MAG TPA: glycosyltransferase family 9 protein, partial [Tepidisphaeraceae bacterium]|nr:glycosyltransferase family 9 protein [Tepidisphaeraceae bacterium]